MKYGLAIFLLLLCLTSCNRCATDKSKTDLVQSPDDIQGHVTKDITHQIEALSDTASFFWIGKCKIRAVKQLRHVYQINKKESFWSYRGKLNIQGDSLLFLLRNAREFGLIPRDYFVPQIDSLLRTAQDPKTKKFNAANYARADLLLTDAFFVFATHLKIGRLRIDTALPAFRISEMRINLDSLFTITHKNGKYRACFDSLEPKQEQYRLLKAQLARYRMMWEKNPWDSLPLIQKDTVAFYRALKNMLCKTLDYDSTVSGNDSVKLSKAIKKFQKRYFLEQDGKLGKNTMPVLRLTSEQRIRQIEMNMERWRQEPARYPKRCMLVNIPQYQMKVMDDDTVYMESKIVVGQPEKPTPLLESQVIYIMLYPYWNVPFSIASKEILPVLKRDTSYLRKKNFDVIDMNGEIADPTKINWKRYTEHYLPYRFRQREGEDNSLGIMKFNFNNKFGVYMHDTNSKRYFKRDVRALSHGCMRLENYMDLAKYLIRLDSVKYPVDSLLTDIMKEKQKQINIKKPLPIYTKYFTALVDDSGTLNLFMDIYRRDEGMEKVLY